MPSQKYYRENFSRIYENVRKQSPPHHFEFSDPFWVLITTMLSHRTKDPVTDAAARNLQQKYMDCNGLSEASFDDVLKIIEKVGFRTVKASRVIQAASIIREKFNGKVPGNREELMEIPGVGRKTANVVLSDSLGIPAIAVDTHVHRISNRVGFSSSKNPDEVESALMNIIPEDDWIGFNPVMVEFGKNICKPVGPKCPECSISGFCSYFSGLQKKAGKRRERG